MLEDFSQGFISSVKKFEEMLKTNFTYFFDAQEIEYIAQHYIDFGKINLAKKAIKIGNKQHPVNINILLLKSEISILEDKLETANKILAFINEIEPNNLDAYIQKATILSKLKKHHKSIEILNECLTYSEYKFEVWHLIALEFLTIDNFQKAMVYFRLCIENEPSDHQILYNLIYCIDNLKSFKEGVKILNEILEKDPYNELVWLELGKLYLQLKNSNKALMSFDYAILCDDKFSAAYVEKAKLLQKNDNYLEAIENYQLSLSFESPSAFIYLRIGECFKMLRKKKLELKYYKLSIKEDPNYEESWLALIEYYLNKNNFKSALIYCNKAIKINENYPEYWKMYAKINKCLNRFMAAEEAFKNIIDLGIDELRNWSGWIDTLISQNKWEKGFLIGKKAKKLYPNVPDLDFKIALCYLNLGKKNEMEFYLENVRKNIKLLSPKLLEFYPHLEVLI
tara:strand:+ start:4285 stop:5643 length:1359 start_codon:yes stop_codon:yes gene_type:complete